ncbi:hypothetical protein HOF78_02195 [Candidatus Woesearchaeota archaeon]|nr:hypothetical protein [Candidatus Woesearchaeota archaeon]MBT6044855.1 hypothetical protein [Candidatus Woesearchaeota archaeon]
MKYRGRRNKKGQAAITDLFVAVGIFIILITITSVLWNLYNVRLLNRLEYDDLVVKTFEISDLLLKSSGQPDNWDHLALGGASAEDIMFVGLVEEELKIPFNKTEGMDALGEEAIRDIFHAGQYRLGIRIRNNIAEEMYVLGKVSGGSKFSVNLGRDVLYQNSTGGIYFPAVIEVILSK